MPYHHLFSIDSLRVNYVGLDRYSILLMPEFSMCDDNQLSLAHFQKQGSPYLQLFEVLLSFLEHSPIL